MHCNRLVVVPNWRAQLKIFGDQPANLQWAVLKIYRQLLANFHFILKLPDGGKGDGVVLSAPGCDVE